MRLNIVTNHEDYVMDCLVHAFANTEHGVRPYLANRPAKGIIEVDFVADDICCISLESVKEALPFLSDYDIRLVIGK